MNSSKEIQQAKQLLKDNGFYIENLWHVDDVKFGANSEDKYIECTNNEAYEILSEAIEQESINESIFDNIQAINEAKFRTMNIYTKKGELTSYALRCGYVAFINGYNLEFIHNLYRVTSDNINESFTTLKQAKEFIRSI